MALVMLSITGAPDVAEAGQDAFIRLLAGFIRAA